MNFLLLMMGGNGTRFGAEIPKQYLKIDGKPIFYYIIKKYALLKEIDRICIVSHTDWLDYVANAITDIPSHYPILITPGGSSRSTSVRNGLQAIKDFASDRDVVLIHDATHPYVDQEGTLAVIDAVNSFGGATLGARQYDTCYRMDGSGDLKQVIPRDELVSGASPEAFRFGDISHIYFNSSEKELEKMTSAGAIALAHGIQMKVIPASTLNLKITYPKDLELFKLLIHSYFFEETGKEEDRQ